VSQNGELPTGVYRHPRVFLCGPNIDSETILGDWVVPQAEDDVITVLEGVKAVCPGASIDTMTFRGRVTAVDDAGIRQAAAKARRADVNILLLGDNSQRYSAFGRTCGENCDRDNIDLPGRQQELLEAVAASGRPTVLILMSGRALGVQWAAESPSVNAILEAWEPGQMGGQAIAEVLFGLVNPSGKLPVTIPRNAGQIQCVYNHKHSQYSRHFALAEQGPLYPFGFGLSYTEFAVAGASEKDGAVQAEIVNRGSRAGDALVQVYVACDSPFAPVRPRLCGFAHITLEAGEKGSVSVPLDPLTGTVINDDGEKVSAGQYTLYVGLSQPDELSVSMSGTAPVILRK
jgi:beta-glucosidase